MHTILKRSVVLYCACLLLLTHAIPLKKRDLFRRPSRKSDGSLGCISMESQEGEYWFLSPGNERVCALFAIGGNNQLVALEFEEFEIDCSSGGLLSVVDGWELNGEFFPGPDDHQIPLDARYRTFCGSNKPRKIYISSQNVALLQFRIPTEGEGFRVRVRYIPNPDPCNAVSMFEEGYHTVRNYGKRRNCSVSIIYPERIKMLSVDVGVTSVLGKDNLETGPKQTCSGNGGQDYVEVLDGNGLDPFYMKRTLGFCGLDSNIRSEGIVLGCQHSVIRLVSSGRFYNSVTFAYSMPSEEQLSNADQSHCDAM